MRERRRQLPARPSRFPPNLGAARLGTKRAGAPGAAAGRGWRRPSGLGGKPSAASLPAPPLPGAWPAAAPAAAFEAPQSSPGRARPGSPLKPPLTRRWAPPKPPPPPGLGPSRRPPPHGPRVAITFAASPPPLPPPPSSPQPSAEAEAAPAGPAASLSRSRSRRRDPRGGACALRAAVGVGGVPSGPGSGGAAARAPRVGGRGGARSARPPRRRQLSVTGCARSRAVPSAVGGARWRGAGVTPALGAPEPGWAADLACCSTGSSPPVSFSEGPATNGVMETRLT